MLDFKILILKFNFCQNKKGLSDPYCKVSVIYDPKKSAEIKGSTIIQTPPTTPNQIKRTKSLFSCANLSCKNVFFR